VTDVWAVVPAAGSGSRFGGDVPKQYIHVAGQPLIAHALDALLAHPDVAGVMVALAADDTHWPRWTERLGKPVHTCVGGMDRARSVLEALHALAAHTGDDVLVLVHDAARACLDTRDVDRLITVARETADGALLATPVRDTLKRSDDAGRSAGTEPRERLWRALTPQAARLGVLRGALERALAAGSAITDEAMALEHVGLRPRLVEGREDNIKLTAPSDRALVEFILERRSRATDTP
jgi:2-C-methyl-D-erythritol 4-phosphate cytidylyltransferase